MCERIAVWPSGDDFVNELDHSVIELDHFVNDLLCGNSFKNELPLGTIL